MEHSAGLYDPRVAVAWHAVRHCLTVRYSKAVGEPRKRWERVLRENSKGYHDRFHTGLSKDELESWDSLYQTYDFHLKTKAKLVFACPIGPRGTSRKARRAINSALEYAEEAGFDYKEPATATAR